LEIPGISSSSLRPKVAIIREEGSHGDREMSAAFFMAGFEPWDVKTSDIITRKISLQHFAGAAFVGGFSYADVMDSAKGWGGSIIFNEHAAEEFRKFFSRDDTFSLGICNGCQLMTVLGWLPYGNSQVPSEHQPRFIHNQSGRFESRFVTVRILESPSIMLKGMAGSSLGIWVQHGEGRAYFPDKKVLERVLSERLAPVRYVDDNDQITTAYPFNPNGSTEGIAGLVSSNGRHLVIMPHPERCFLKWQWPWMPPQWMDRNGDNSDTSLAASPWLRMFQNARTWVEENRRKS